jgi:hypothetical protein
VNRKTEIRNISLGILMTGISIWALSENSIYGWIGTLFFGISTIVLIIVRYRRTNGLINNIENEEFDLKTKNEFENIFNETGIFTYNDNGFFVETEQAKLSAKWTEVKSLLGYKEDHYTSDSICLDIFCDNHEGFSITEETKGWYMFLERSKEALPTIDISWEVEISTPAFETNLTLVYDSQNRTLKEVTDEYYKS